MMEVLAAVTAIALAVATVRLGMFLSVQMTRTRDERRFGLIDREELDRAFARVLAEQPVLDD